MSGLFSPFKIKNVELKNRIVMPPMCMVQAVDGFVEDWHRIHYATRAIGGVGLIVVEATAVSPEGRILDGDLGIWSDEHVPGLKEVADLIHKYGAKAAIQLGHAGRKAKLSVEHCMAPSPVRFDEDFQVPHAMTLEDIGRVVEDFRQGARRAREAGFDIIEIHGAHGYLINQFMTPLCNKREDAYGGSMENRGRFLWEVTRAVRQEWPEENPLMLRVSSKEYHAEGNTESDVAGIINHCKQEGIDMIHVSTGGVLPSAVLSYPGYQIETGKLMKEGTGLPVIVGGLVTEPGMADEIIWNGRGDLVFLGRELLRNPYWPLQAARKLKVDIPWPAPYVRSK
ncbi:NADPH dehydrogenase NamA [Anaerotalea alkaliphila]|uniref:NADPH dehydrogenase NamA n=1 Tax=Anaerotalea alkaliphila TaxID=2662126 RepID=A0A7X5HVI0_9FIRM|nr:NADPH dehydrogenase NamA [Anaerotalea alkaliphila]NDL67415.1 NADPH dehydrogenase NamA [Anaerotalea alkaliphila]